jgi:hypothetical protein
MSDFKHTSMLMTEHEQVMDQISRDGRQSLLEDIKRLKAENEGLRTKVEFHERNSKLMEKAMTMADRAKFEKDRKINQLESKIASTRLVLGQMCWVVDYPNDDSKSVFDALRKDAERYRWLRTEGYRDPDTDMWSGSGDTCDEFTDGMRK